MKNIELQKVLDVERQSISEEIGEDLSGEMLYCEFCYYATHKKCNAINNEREKYSLCATAHNRMKKRNQILYKK